MSIDIGIGKSLSNGDATLFAAKTEAMTATQRVQEGHPAYSWVWTDEIRCRGCDARLEIPVLASTRASADKAFRAHQAAELDALLAAGGKAA
ncbi:hypothetical protein ACLH0K_13445 [Arthrobacter sp. MPF02]|uniref:hypothetical protein n=1 Tax=Arthrobacter sp. MPF02 TaxID=3388492 RepID=UPI0039847DD4